ncbi:MAG: TRAP transporter substrate-binding protein [Paracoccus sp. (in: a-proteobacteria)]|uniref:TRAP transporter substrate-binding protein n=1 Tax=unclassified Paracoccus (in: a-proteobacteria) TaxID=2688777 RepID=UPI000C5820F0|nr:MULTISPECIES: TRAP transporter substrate-binding protein [unclassified Paracoccus (in: a-proteobacteria)]MAN56109.1 C4-dicarboxylate ABC transporter substrate-binding protein [Paracoccus sp. (in: a-proteobacteria)]MBA50491.1 C4-dicarboxylate ABC transporter substrate-binding protein [Paracoccus sp. (in: a-proteobacteria)]MCS5601548.1 TRAP transporter substrate-binding protein [Paracoccus sp. (in: a-proteobacteria)]HIC65778.1 TRAP transporter substrate-binding protein [Paracoccus sp. (in: a-p|tara:strand:- start:1307 stop:2311 length:1005 start_codon:yes stop_codon:yes gene_type:complete
MSYMTRFLTGTALTLALAVPAAAKEYRIAVGDGAGGSQEALGKAFVAALEEQTGGEMTGKLFLNGQLGDEQDTVTAAATGTLDFSILAINNITPFSPSVGTLTLPYVILSQDDAEKITQGEVGQQMIDQTIEDAGVRIIGWGYSGFRVLSNSKRPVSTVADLQGLVIRVPKNEIMIETYKSWGLNPTPMAWGETFAALQQKVVDGQDNPYLTIYAMKFDEVQKYITDLRYLFSIEPLIVSEALFESLSEDQQQQVLAAGKAATQASSEFLRSEESKIRDELVSRGMEITQPADDEKEFRDLATAAVWPQFYDQIGGKEVLDNVLTSLGREPAPQ